METTIRKQSLGGVLLGRIRQDGHVWLARRIGEIKEHVDGTISDTTGTTVETRVENKELRWARINPETIGEGPRLWHGMP